MDSKLDYTTQDNNIIREDNIPTENINDNTAQDNKIIKEMVETETSYNNALVLLELAFTIEILGGKNPLFTKIRDHVSALKEISNGLLANVNEALNTKLSTEDRKSLRISRTQFLKAFFAAYKPYLELYDEYLVESKKSPEQFNLIKDYVYKNNPGHLKLEDLLIQPIQRGPRYALLVAATKKMNEHLDDFNIDEFAELDALIAECLMESTTSTTKEEPGYHVGDLSKAAFKAIKSYRIGDISRALLIWGKSQPIEHEISAPVLTPPPSRTPS